MIFSLPPALIKTTEKVLHNNKQAVYIGANKDALNKWIEAMNKKANR
jgi:hypothetical protein